MASVSAQFFRVKILEEPTKNIGCPQPQLKKMMDPHSMIPDNPDMFSGQLSQIRSFDHSIEEVE
jgi:hypothetical protein